MEFKRSAICDHNLVISSLGRWIHDSMVASSIPVARWPPRLVAYRDRVDVFVPANHLSTDAGFVP